MGDAEIITLLYMGESTNIERAGYTMSEAVVGATLDRLFAENAERRIIVATFASNVGILRPAAFLLQTPKNRLWNG